MVAISERDHKVLKGRELKGKKVLKEGSASQIRVSEVSVPHNTLLEGNSLEILSPEVRVVKVHASSDDLGNAALKRARASPQDLRVGSIIRS